MNDRKVCTASAISTSLPAIVDRPRVISAPQSIATDEKSPTWLRTFEIAAGVIILLFGAAVILGMDWVTSVAFLAAALIVLEMAYVLRTSAQGILGQRRPNVVLCVLTSLIAASALIALFFFGFMTLIYLLAFGLIFAGIAGPVTDACGKTVGIVGIFAGAIAVIDPMFFNPAAATQVSTNLIALLALPVIVFGLEPVIAGVTGSRADW